MIPSVAVSDAVLLKDLVGEACACLECKLFREDKCIIAVEEEIFDLFV